MIKILSVLVALSLFLPTNPPTINKDAIGGVSGVPIYFFSVDELTEYIEDEQWKIDKPGLELSQKNQIDYLQIMDEELFLPVGYSKNDIEAILIDKYQVIICLPDSKYFYYYFTKSSGAKDIIEGTNVGTPTYFHIGNNYDPKVYNIYEADNSVDLEVNDPVECGDFEYIQVN